MLWSTIPFSVFVLIAMFFILPLGLERGGMEPEVSKTAYGYKDDVKHILKIRTFLCMELRKTKNYISILILYLVSYSC